MAVTDIITDREVLTGVSIRRAVEAGDPAAVGDGVANDALALQRFMSSTLILDAETALVPRGTYRISTSLTFTHFMRFAHGAVLSIDSGVTLTLSAGLDAPLRQIFTGAGTVVFSPGTVECAYPQWWGAKGDGTTNDTASIQAALDALEVMGGGSLRFPKGTYMVSDMLIYNADNLRMYGEGTASVLKCTAAFVTSGSPKWMFEFSVLKTGCEICYLKLEGQAGGYAFNGIGGIHGNSTSKHLRIHHCEFRRLGGYGATDHSQSYEGEVTNNRFEECFYGFIASGTAENHNVRCENNTFVNCYRSVVLQGGNSCPVVGNTFRTTAAYIPVNTDECDIFVGNMESTVITGNTFEATDAAARRAAAVVIGASDTSVTTFGYAGAVVVSGNAFIGAYTRAVELRGAQYSIVQDNTIQSLAAGIASVLTGVYVGPHPTTGQQSLYCVIEGNMMRVDAAGSGVEFSGADNSYSQVKGNHFIQGSASLMVKSAGPTVTVRRNIGWKTENSGTAIIPLSGTSILVPHGLAITPQLASIRVSGPTQDTSAWWITSIGSANFTINVPAAVGAARTVGWAVVNPAESL